MGDQLVCMSPEDWNCSVQGHYVRESICARLWGGTPADYDDKVVLSKDDRFEGTFDCAHLPEPVEDDPETPEDETVPEILLGVGLGTGCDNCRVCDSQLAGWFANGAPDDAWNEFPACPGKAEDPQGNPYPDNDALNAWCGGEPDPTTGGGGGTTTGGGGGTGIWVCNGSPTICGTMTDTFPPPTMDERCLTGNTPFCVIAADMETAEGKCYNVCKEVNGGHQEEADKSTTKNWNPSFPCDDLVSGFDPVETTDPQTMCAGGGPVTLENPLPFAATAELAIGGGAATSNQLNGVMDFTIETCPSTAAVCDVSITGIYSSASLVRGVHTVRAPDGSTSSTPFTIADLEVRLLQPVVGELNQQMGLVTFPDEDFFVVISTGAATLDGVPLSAGIDDVVFVIEGARGVWNSGHLTLDLTWASGVTSLWLRISG